MRRTIFITLASIIFLGGCAHRTDPISSSIEIFGEIHGTNEIPEHFLELVVGRVRQGEKLQIGIELTQSEIDSACGALRPQNREESSIVGWFGSTQDGRFSGAMARMICNLGRERHIDLFPLISNNGSSLRDRMIYESIAQRRKENEPIIALVGNLHARNTATSAAGLLRSDGFEVKTTVYDARNGENAWICTGDETCGATPVSARFCSTNEELSMSGVIIKETIGARWDRCISLHRISASPPIERR